MALIWSSLLIGIRIMLLTAAVIAGVIFLFANAREALAASLKDVSIVTESTLKLGDVFEGLSKNADYVLGPSPAPGQEMVLNAKTLYRIALAMDLPWSPAHSTQQVVIRRAATTIPADDLKQAVMARLEEEGVQRDFDLTFYSEVKDVTLPSNKSPLIEIESFNFDPQGDFFEAVLVSPSRSDVQARIPVSGKIERTIEIPVLRTALKNGDVIGATDIEWVSIHARKIQRDVVMKSEDLIGRTPRRAAFPGKPLLANDLERPQVVQRGETITIVYADGAMRLSTKGKAMQNGALGDVIRVSNLNSNKSVDGMITNSGEVTVQ